MLRTTRLVLGALAFAVSFAPRPVEAGCGCEKPPPAPAAVRPAFAYPGAPVTLISPEFRTGDRYSVTFTSGGTGATARVQVPAVMKRDLADGVSKRQLVVPLPSLPLGPARIVVTHVGGESPILSVDDASFTVVPTPVVVPGEYGEFQLTGYQAAVGRDGVLYMALDLLDVSRPLVLEARAAGYPLRFTNEDVTFYNAQGFLMQRLLEESGRRAEPIPGMFVVAAPNHASDSDALHYSRHEFATFFLQHAERYPHALDGADPNWHGDGTRHIDHQHLILAITGLVNEAPPAPGATPAFDLMVTTHSLFYQGLVGIEDVTLSENAVCDGYSAAGAGYTSDGDVFSNGTMSMSDGATVYGDATAQDFELSGGARIVGAQTEGTWPATFMQVQVPSLLPDLGVIDLVGSAQTIVGPGSFLVKSLTVGSGGRLFVDNATGPVTLYVRGRVTLKRGGVIDLADPNPEKFALYAAGKKPVALSGDGTTFHGVVYAPRSTVSISGEGEFFGAFVGKAMRLSDDAHVHYYSALRGE